MPFYNEIDIFGFKLKKEIVGLQKELNEVKNNMILANTNNQTLYNILPTPSSDEKLNEIAKNLEKLTNHNKVHINTDEVVDIPENNLFLFKVRYSIENEINRIVKQMNSKNGLGLNLYRMTLTLKLSALLEEDVIDSVLFETLREVIIICDAGVYREVIQKNKIQFVRKTMTKTIELLRSINI